MIMGLLKSVKFWAILGAVTAILVFVKWAHGEIYDSGYNAAELKWRAAQQTAIDEAVAEAREADRIAHNAAMANIKTETEIVERVRIVEREVPKIVERVVIPECRNLGPDIMVLFNKAIISSMTNEHEEAGPDG